MLLVAALAAAGGYFVAMKLSGPAAADPAAGLAAPTQASLLGRPRPDFELRDAGDRPVSAAAFDGKPLLLNFWATWCAPCVEEMPMLAEVQRHYTAQGLQVVGIAVDEPGRAQSFAAGMGLDYPLLYGIGEAMLTQRRYGNASGMLPYSVLIDADGRVRWTHLGALSREQLDARIAELR